MKCLLIGPKNQGIGSYVKLLSDGLNSVGIETDWVGFPDICFDRDVVLRRTAQLARQINLHAYDLVHFQFGMFDMEQALLLHMKNDGSIPWIFSAHSISGQLFAKMEEALLQDEVERLLHTQFNHYVFFSTYGCLGFDGLGANQATVLYHPSSQELTHLTRFESERIRQRYDLPESFLALPGYPSPWKDYNTLLQALSLMDDAVDFVFAGPRWSQKVSEAFKSGGPVRVRVVDRVLNDQEFLALVRRSLFGVLPYQAHPTRQGGGVLPNYLWEGKACIVTDVLCLPEYLGEAGLVVPPGNPHALAQAITLLLRDLDYRKQLERLAKDRAKAMFSWSAHIAAHKRLYLDVLTK